MPTTQQKETTLREKWHKETGTEATVNEECIENGTADPQCDLSDL